MNEFADSDISKVASLMGKKGGSRTVERHGKEFMKEISKKGVEARRANKANKITPLT